MSVHYEIDVRKPDGRTYRLGGHGWFGTHERPQAEEAARAWAERRPENTYRVLEVETHIREVAAFGACIGHVNCGGGQHDPTCPRSRP